jgi:hypothetical protein
MSRKLTHSIRALAVGFGIFATAVGIAVDFGHNPAATTSQAEVAQGTATPLVAPKAAVGKPVGAKHRQRRREAHEEISMPFFSFARALRRGNGS